MQMADMATAPKVERTSIQPSADKLISYEQLEAEVERLSRSQFVHSSVVGTTPAGRNIYLLAISSPRNLANAERHKAAARMAEKLVHYSSLSEPHIDKTAIPKSPPDWVPAVLIHCGAFGFEAAHTEAGLALADLLSTQKLPGADRILQELIVLILPMINPDGRLLAIEQWRKAPLCAGFAGSGNGAGLYLNRDFNRLSQAETCAAHKVYNEWHPLAAYDPHEDMCLLGVTHPDKVCWAPPFLRPHHPDVSPGVLNFVDRFGTAVAQEWRKAGYSVLHDEQNGALLDLVMLDGRFDLHLDLHGTPTLITESGRTPGLQTWTDRVQQKIIAGRVFLNCCVEWKQELFATQHQFWLENVTRGQMEEPDAIIIPRDTPEQADVTMAAELVKILQRHELQVYCTDKPYRSWVIPLAQPYRAVIRAMLLAERWNFYALPPAFGVTSFALRALPTNLRKSFHEARLKVWPPEPTRVSSVPKEGCSIINNAFGVRLVNELLRGGAEVYWDGVGEDAGFVAKRIPEGFPVSGPEASTITAARAPKGPKLKRCRVALFSGQGVDEIHHVYWADSYQSLQFLKFDFECLTASDLHEKLAGFDVLLVPGGDAEQILHGWQPEHMFNHNPWQMPGKREGLGDDGICRIREFIENGGTYVGIGAGGGVLAAREYAGFADVSIAAHSLGQGRVFLKLRRHPITSGLKPYRSQDGTSRPDVIAAPYHSDMVITTCGGPLFTVGREEESIDDYCDVDDEPWTGNIKGDSGLFRSGYSAVVHQRLGKGHVILFGINPDFRATWLSTHVMLSNALFFATV